MKSNFIEWNADDVINWIRHDVKLLNINYDLIKSHEINGRDLIDLNEDNLKEDLKILKLHDRKHLMRKICELMRALAEAPANENEIENQISFDKNSEIKTIKIKFEEKTVTFKCANNIKVEHVIKECIDVFDLNNRNNAEIKLKNKNNSFDKEHQYNISDFFLSDTLAVIYPKENYISDILQDYYNNSIDTSRKEVLTYYLNNKKEESIARNSISQNSNGIHKNPASTLAVYTKHNEIFKETLPNKNINMHSNDISFDRLKPKEDNNNYYKDFSITETAVKNRYVSFEALDNLEKNGYSFINKKLNSHLNKTKEEKVTINSFYNISNLNNFNEKSLKSIKSLNSSNDRKRLGTKENMVSDTYSSHKNEPTHVNKSNRKKDKVGSMNIYSRKLEFDELSEKEVNIKENIHENEKTSSNGKIELDEYMKILSFRTGVNTSDYFEKNKFKRMKNIPISNNQSRDYYCNREYIHEGTPKTSHAQNNKKKLQNQSNEEEIENFLNTVKNRNSSTIEQSTGNKMNINNPHYNQDSSSHYQINPFIRNSTNNLKNIPTAKNNLRHLIYHNITTGRDGMSIDSSVIN